MKFRKKLNQQVLEVLAYDDGPLCYGFYQARKFYLAFFLEQTESDQKWIYLPLEKTDLSHYEDLKSGKLKISDFIKGRKAILTIWNHRENQTDEECLNQIPTVWLPKINSISLK